MQVTDFTHYDYIGAPWSSFRGVAGGGGVSIRNVTVMLALLRRELASLRHEEREDAFLKWGQEDDFFVSRMVRAMAAGDTFKLPSAQVRTGYVHFMMIMVETFSLWVDCMLTPFDCWLA
jgi:hypothetical protein